MKQKNNIVHCMVNDVNMVLYEVKMVIIIMLCLYSFLVRHRN